LLIAATPTSSSWKQRTLKSAGPFIDRANREWTRAIVTGNADVLSAPYATDGLFIGRDGTTVRGKAAVRAMYSKRPADVSVIKASISSDGRAAHDPRDVYEWGSAHLTVRQGKSVRRTSGRYLTVWHREGARWVITRNIAF
jgi:ketosteroid isomerase-like protein